MLVGGQTKQDGCLHKACESVSGPLIAGALQIKSDLTVLRKLQGKHNDVYFKNIQEIGQHTERGETRMGK